ncbi:MBL fold metallo-hydrolase [Lederbergia wuyishanensis]|uniref:Ribonuclease BN (tRNA processing enzyme) n=1 Tax=Lederbergia wuyishanensis TaxID=1347903 RepID=A0ABU0CYT0_9BACI|nr:MBL fold metallo-hydrolase [Lederbergia wuyishanensis]MCJ8005947.1 MBL fold metallo-hydrolase [Lederbergia wuyishanensis]MDQ0341312.1 ribonuclease BN (tRNA processing enzyme) [Lederbergia wuyishanensis]
MELTVIGHWGGYPKAGEASSGYLLTHEGFNLLVDCGSAVLSQLQMYIKPEELNAVILSHYHADHIADIGVLHHALLIGKYVSGYDRNLSIYGHSKDPDGLSSLTYKDITTGIAYDKDNFIHIGPFKIEFIRTKHPVACYAMRITCEGKTLVYTADTSYFDELVEFSMDADVLLAESNFYKGMDGASAGHMTSEEAGRLAKKANVDTLVLTHLPHFGDLNQLKAEAAEQFEQEIILASKGLILSF